MSERAADNALTTGRRRQHRDRRLQAVLLLVALVAVASYLVGVLPKRGIDATKLAGQQSRAAASAEDFSALTASAPPARGVEARIEESLPSESSPAPEKSSARQVLDQARALLKKRQYESAIHLLNQERPQLQNHAEAYFLLGKALEGRRDYRTARDFYVAAIDRAPYLSDAYWGVATTSEHLGELDAAIGAMRSYLHTERDADPQRLRIAQARSAIWEWEAKLGRGPWGPTRGIPPGFAAEDLKRDGRGVGVKIPRLDTLQPDGTMQSEVKHADKVKIFPRP